MTTAFLQKLLAHGSLDTRKYRYKTVDHGYCVDVYRIPREYLDTVIATYSWERIARLQDTFH